MFPDPTYPTPLTRCELPNASGAELWLKNDGVTHPVYGGNKVRKAVGLIAEAKRRNAKRVLTIGAVGSHHVLTMALFARAAGLRCGAVLIPQPRTPHVVDTVRASIAHGVEVSCAPWTWLVPFTLAATYRPGDFYVPPGGSNVLGALAYADAVEELARQLEAEGRPAPDWIVVPVGSGGTCAGIVAGVIRHRLASRVLAVQIVPGFSVRWLTRRLTRQVLAALGVDDIEPALGRVLHFDSAQAGRGYGYATPQGERAAAAAAELGLELDQTYTAKAFASVRALFEHPERHREAKGSPLRVLYWHTLAATPLDELLTNAPEESQLPPGVRGLLR